MTDRKMIRSLVDADILTAARELEIDISSACEQGLELAIAEKRAMLWVSAHRDYVDAYISYVGNFALPVAKLLELKSLA